MDTNGSNDGIACTCCGNRFHVHDLAWCSICGEPFHLALRTDVPIADCGQAWLSDEVETVVFGCNRCLAADLNPAAGTGSSTLP